MPSLSRLKLLPFLAVMLMTWPAAAEDKLAEAPAGAQSWVIVSNAGQHGWSKLWVSTDGTRWSREHLILRGFKTDIDQQMRIVGGSGLHKFQVRGVTPQGDAAENYSAANGRFSFTSPVDSGSGQVAPDKLYASFGGTIESAIFLVDAVRKSPAHKINLIPSGQLSIMPLTQAQVSNGKETKKLTAYAVTGFGFSPTPIWYDGDSFFGLVGVISYIKEGWASVAPKLSEIQDQALAQQAPAELARLAPKSAEPIAFKDIQLFDSKIGRFQPGMTIVVDHELIADVGPAATTKIPAGARIIEGKGKTLLPGLWDSHMHYGDDSTGALLLAQGITSTRDPGNQQQELMARKSRIEAQSLLGTRIVPSLIIDGPGERSAQAAVVVKSEIEALSAVRRAKHDGYFAIKLYGSLNPAFVKPMAKEAHRLGLRVHGHIPAGMRPLEAVRAGYDEITHIYFVMMQAMPDSVVNQSNGTERIFGPGRYAASVNLASPDFSAYLKELSARKVAIDPTLVVAETLFLGERRKLANAYIPFSGTLPPQVERGFKAGGLQPPPDLSPDTMKRSFTKLRDLVAAFHAERGTIVAGTDGTGLELVRELELYVEAGLTPEQALLTATSVPAKTFGAGADSGTIEKGKKAELFVVTGNPATKIGDLRHVEYVMRDGRLMRASDLRASLGISGMPR